MEALRIHFPTDIANMILEKSNRSEHNDKLELCLDSLQVNIFCSSYLQFCQEIQDYTTAEQDRKIKSEYPHIQDILTMLSKCSCCEIHNIYKPISYRFADTCDYRICCSPPKTKITKDCDCPCRHVARNLMRAYTYTEIEHVEDERHLLHVQYLDLKETQRKLKTKLEIVSNKKQKLKHKINNNNVSDATYTKYYASVDQVLELQIQLGISNVKLDEAKFNLHTHITDYPDIFTNTDALFGSFSK
jgi:hypothetical protein